MPRDGISSDQEAFERYELGAPRMPHSWVIGMLQNCGLEMQNRAHAERDQAAAATADVLLNLASGWDEAAIESIGTATALRRIRA
jgi:hypothetical protein